MQYYGSDQLDSSLLMLARVGFLPPDRSRGSSAPSRRSNASSWSTASCSATRPPTTTSVDGLPAGEGTFLLTTFWLVDNLALIGREDEARELFERLRSLQNDVGMFVGGVRPDHEAHDRQLPAGVLAPRIHRVGVASLGRRTRRRSRPASTTEE